MIKKAKNTDLRYFTISLDIVFTVINLVVFFLNRQYPKRVAFTTIAIALMVGFELAFASLKFIW